MSRGQNKVRFASITAALAAFAVACGGSPPATAEPRPEPVTEPPIDEVEQPQVNEPKESTEESASPAEKTPAVEPQFKEGMSVNDAINAVPQGTSRVNVDSEELGKPLANAELYAPCKLAAAQHFKLNVAVWNGKAVGVDVVTTPPNKNAEQCIDKQVRSITWPQKVQSLNQVEYSY